MKHNRKHNMFGWLAASALLLTTACSDNVALDVAQGDTNGANTVTFTIMPQTQELGTRADGDIDTRNKYISDGTKADVLIFAVYKNTGTDENPIWTPDPEFCKGDQTGDGFLPEGTLGEAQNAIKVDQYPVTIQLYVTDYDAEYKVAFWAQNHETTAYDTKNLQRVKVNYKNADGSLAKNNDELRDAFCAVTEKAFTGATKETQTVTLRRPLAQVNVGTAGWDYEGAAFLKPAPVSYTHSKITLKGVAQYYDMLESHALSQEELDAAIEANPEDFSDNPKDDDHKAITDVTFGFNLLPAFIQDEDEKWKEQYTPVNNEEYLQVDVNRDKKIDPYVSWEDYEKYSKGEDTKELFDQDILPATETYKYLSMCYVLAPNTTTDENDNEVSSVLEKVTFEIVGHDTEEAEEGEDVEPDDATLKTVFSINNVPVRKNWRTNIVGDNFFTTVTKFHLDIVPEYFGDYNYNGWEYGAPDQGDSWNGEIGYTYTLSFSAKGKQESSTAPDNNGNFFTTTKASNDVSDESVDAVKPSFSYGIGTYNGKSYQYVKKMDSKASISFTTKFNSTVIIVASNSYSQNNGGLQNVSGRVEVDDKELLASSATQPDKNCYIYTISVPAGNHTIKKVDAAYQFGIYYVEVKTPSFFDGETPNTFPEGPFDEKYPDYKGNGNE